MYFIFSIYLSIQYNKDYKQCHTVNKFSRIYTKFFFGLRNDSILKKGSISIKLFLLDYITLFFIKLINSVLWKAPISKITGFLKMNMIFKMYLTLFFFMGIMMFQHSQLIAEFECYTSLTVLYILNHVQFFYFLIQYNTDYKRSQQKDLPKAEYYNIL